MTRLKIYSEKEISKHIGKRPGERKFGESLSFVQDFQELKNHPARYVLLGIPEDIGVRANYGIAGTASAWKEAVGSLLNIQDNGLTRPESVILLGEINCRKEMEEAARLSENNSPPEEFGKLVEQIDDKVSETIQEIVAAGKIPIVIGGGHNNSYGNLKGTSKALKKPVNCINLDAHSDFRPLEHRHSGNGFSYAFEHGYLNKYFIVGLHRNYTSKGIFNSMQRLPVKFNLFETIKIHKNQSFKEALQEAEEFCAGSAFGIELDMDAIEMMGSSAISPAGFSLNEARQFITRFAKNPHAKYFHICEGAPNRAGFPNQTGKAIAYLVSDIIAEI